MKVLLIFCGVFSLSAVSQYLVAREAAPSGSPGSQEMADARFVPAELSFAGAETIADLIRFPDTEGDVTVALYCTLQVQSSDTFSNFCFAPDGATAAFEAALREVLPRLRVSAARVDGRRKPVSVPYSVEFLKRGDDERVQMYENYGVEVAQYDRQYAGPQRMLTSSEHASRVSRACQSSQPEKLVWVRANVTADGEPQGVRVVTDTSEACREGIEALFAESAYIPAHYRGKPVSAELLEPFFPMLHLDGSCNTPTHNTQGHAPLHGLRQWRISRHC